MNYRFKQAVQEELARLETMHLEVLGHRDTFIKNMEYAKTFKTPTMKTSFPIGKMLRFLSLL